MGCLLALLQGRIESDPESREGSQDDDEDQAGTETILKLLEH